MKPRDLEKVLSTIHDTAGQALDHMAARFSGAADKLGEEYAHLADFSGTWKKLPKASRKLFVEQLLKSSGMVVGAALAAKAGVKLADKSRNGLTKAILVAADLIEPAAKTTKKAKKRAKKAKKRVKKALA